MRLFRRLVYIAGILALTACGGGNSHLNSNTQTGQEGSLDSPVSVGLSQVYTGYVDSTSSYYVVNGLAAGDYYRVDVTNIQDDVNLSVYADPAFTNSVCSSGISEITFTNFKTALSANDGTSGNELWCSDASVGGTTLVKDINSGITGSSPAMLTDVAGTLYFTADDGTGRQLWKSDCTNTGTVKLLQNNGKAVDNPAGLVSSGGVLYFRYNNGVHGSELWRTDGTYMVKDINPVDSSDPYQLTSINGTLYFSANDGVHGTELWKSDGTEQGTIMVDDLRTKGDGSLDK